MCVANALNSRSWAWIDLNRSLSCENIFHPRCLSGLSGLAQALAPPSVFCRIPDFHSTTLQTRCVKDLAFCHFAVKCHEGVASCVPGFQEFNFRVFDAFIE